MSYQLARYKKTRNLYFRSDLVDYVVNEIYKISAISCEALEQIVFNLNEK